VRTCRVFQLDRAVQMAENGLRKSSSPMLDEFDAELLDEMELTRNAGKTERDMAWQDAGEDPRYGQLRKRIVETHSNAKAVQARMTAIRDAREQIELLRLEPIGDDDLAERIAKIRSSISPMESLDALELVTA
jgi:hypothetical protein